MTAVQKFMFDLTFDDTPVISPIIEADLSAEQPEDPVPGEPVEQEVEVEEVQPGFSEHQMEVAKTDAFEAGRLEGVRDASKTVEQDTLNAVRAISQHLTELFGKQEQANNTLMKDGIGVAATIARKLFPALDEANRLDEISRLVEQTLLRLIEEPRVVVKINPVLLDTLGARLDGLKAGAGYEGRIILKEDSTLDPGDCRLEWGDGSAERSAAMLWQSIDTIIEDNVGIVERIVPKDVAVDVTSAENNVAENPPESDDEIEQDASPIEPTDTPSDQVTESSEGISSESAESDTAPETPEQEESPKPAISDDENEQGMLAGDEADIVDTESASEQNDEEPTIASVSGEELSVEDSEIESEEAAPDGIAPDEAAPDEAASDEAAPGGDLPGETVSDDSTDNEPDV